MVTRMVASEKARTRSGCDLGGVRSNAVTTKATFSGTGTRRGHLAHVRLFQEQQNDGNHGQQMEQDDEAYPLSQPGRAQLQHRVTAGANR
jgi:hypothetical protein